MKKLKRIRAKLIDEYGFSKFRKVPAGTVMIFWPTNKEKTEVINFKFSKKVKGLSIFTHQKD